MVMVESLTHHGMGRLTDGTLVPRVLPGEEIEVLADGSARILLPSPVRVAAPCRHFKTCGGCAMQHASDIFVADWKRQIVQQALIGQGIDGLVGQTLTSPPASRRRAKLAGQRTKKGAQVGFHGRGSDHLVAVPDCQLLTSALMAGFPMLERLTVLAASRKTEVALTITDTLNGLDVMVGTDRALTEELRMKLATFAQEYQLARLVWQDEVIVTLNPPAQRFGTATVTPPPGAFLQATAHGEAALLSAVTDITQGARRIVDLFAGCGTFTFSLAKAAEVLAVEGDAAMMAALDRGWRDTPGLKRVQAVTRDLFRRPLEPDELKPFDAAVIDPPRAGAVAQMATLAQSDIPKIAMVSCNPVTFARDAKTLIDGGYRIGPVTVVDQFRWSTHVEIAAGFSRD